MVSGGLGLSLDPLLHSLGGLRMRSESTHQPTHTPTDSLFRPTRATLPTTDSMGRPELLRQVPRREDDRHLGHRAKRLALALLGRGDHALRLSAACQQQTDRHHRTERAVLNF